MITISKTSDAELFKASKIIEIHFETAKLQRSPDLKTGWLSDRILQNGVSLFENLEIAVESSSEGDVRADFTGFVLLG